MKKLIILSLIFTTGSFLRAQQTLSSNDGQKTHQNDSLEANSATFYTSIGISVGNQGDNTFKNTSYLSIENGIMYKDFFGGIVLGNSDLNLGKDNYFYEGKAGYCFPIGILNGTTFFGIGSYFSIDPSVKRSTFIEYGAGLSYTYKKLSFGVCYSNWAGSDYVTPSVTINW